VHRLLIRTIVWLARDTDDSFALCILRYTIVVITNQNGLDGNPDKQTEMRTKFEKICAQLRLPMWILISMQKDHNRKPMTGLWHWLEARFLEDDVEIGKKVHRFD
jgi:DNA 3'-phosphatase